MASFCNQNASVFNQNVEDEQKIIYNAQLQAQKKDVEEKINKVLEGLGNMSKNSKEALGLFQQLSLLSPLLADIGAQVNCVDDEFYYKLYIQYRNIFKEFQDQVEECNVISQMSLAGNANPEKMKQIKESIQKVAKKLSSINSSVYSQSQRYVIWVDFNDSKENKITLLQIQKQFDTSIIVKVYTDINKFKQDYPNFKGQPLFLILSGQVANDYSQTDGKLFKWIKTEWQNKKEDNRIRGIIIYTSDLGVKHMRDKFEKDESKLVKKVTANTTEMLEILYNMISPSKFCRLIGIEEFSALFKTQLKDKLLKMHLTKPSQPLSYYSPENFNYKELFAQALKIIQEKKISFKSDALKFDEILEQLTNIYSQNNNSQNLAQQIIYLYSLEKVPFYKLINTTLNTLNEALITKMMPLIELLQTALYNYDDTILNLGNIKVGEHKKLFRGSSIPDENFEELVQVNKFINLPSFSSFTEDINIAMNFIKMNSFAGTKECIFVYEHLAGNAQFDIRPKFVSPVSYYKNEKEYLTYPCVTYKIASIKKVKYNQQSPDTYTEITLVSK